MSLIDELNLGGVLKSALGQVEASAAPALINALLARTQFGDLNGLLAQLQQGGLGAQVQSWLGNGANMPITADQLKAALGNSRSGHRPPSRPTRRCGAQHALGASAQRDRPGEQERTAAVEQLIVTIAQSRSRHEEEEKQRRGRHEDDRNRRCLVVGGNRRDGGRQLQDPSDWQEAARRRLDQLRQEMLQRSSQYAEAARRGQD
jgi:hypothetical protein